MVRATGNDAFLGKPTALPRSGGTIVRTTVLHAGIGAAVVGGVVLTSSAASAQTFSSQAINATANIHGAGRSGAAQTPQPGGSGGGTAAPGFTLTAGTGRMLTFSSITGSISYNGGGNFNNADGVGNGNSLNVTAYQGISGISFTGRAGFLTGVFVSGPPAGFADGSSGSSAASLSYTATAASIGQTSYSPLLNQAFFIGDGLTGINGDGAGTVQQFFVPDAATQLFLGFADAPGYNGAPGAFSDNSGSFTASFSVTGITAAPEPGTAALFAIGLSVGACRLRRRVR